MAGREQDSELRRKVSFAVEKPVEDTKRDLQICGAKGTSRKTTRARRWRETKWEIQGNWHENRSYCGALLQHL
jgi:hypothetical protein